MEDAVRGKFIGSIVSSQCQLPSSSIPSPPTLCLASECSACVKAVPAGDPWLLAAHFPRIRGRGHHFSGFGQRPQHPCAKKTLAGPRLHKSGRRSVTGLWWTLSPLILVAFASVNSHQEASTHHFTTLYARTSLSDRSLSSLSISEPTT